MVRFKISDPINLILAIPFAAVLITPTTSLDPFGLPKFLVLILFISTYGLYIILSFGKNYFKQFRFIYLTLGIFVASGLASVLNSSAPITENIYGNFGRQTGFFAYISLSILLLASALLSEAKVLKRASNAILFALVFNLIYSFFQILKLDPFNWSIAVAPVFGFFGNPNFLTAFLGMTSVIFVSQLFDNSSLGYRKVISVIWIVFLLYVLFRSGSQQGIFVFFITNCVYIFYLFSINLRVKHLKVFFLIVVTTLLSYGVLDLLQRSPWKSIFYEETISLRGDFWRAGLSMASSNPLTGVGFAGYKDNYLTYRDLKSALRINREENVDSAHNLLIDMLASGGILLFITILILFIYISIVGLILINDKKFRNNYVAIFYSIWIGYLSQALISVESLGIAIVGWISGGLIVGAYLKSKLDSIPINVSKSIVPKKVFFLGIIFTNLVCTPLILVDSKLKFGIENGELAQVVNTTKNWPQDTGKFNFVTKVLIDSKLYDEALIVAREAVEFNPHNFSAWLNLSLIPGISMNEKLKAEEFKSALNPYYKSSK
jgi:O-antigen ligase